jgi:hypothetical protein
MAEERVCMLLWRKDGYGREDHALYLGGLFVGEIMQLDSKKWRAWFMNDDEGHQVGLFDNPLEARVAVESALLKALPDELAIIVEASTAL